MQFSKFNQDDKCLLHNCVKESGILPSFPNMTWDTDKSLLFNDIGSDASASCLESMACVSQVPTTVELDLKAFTKL